MSQRLTVHPRVAGPRLGASVQAVLQASKAGDWSAAPDGVVTCGGVVLEPGEYVVESVLADGAESDAMLPGGGFILLSTAVTADLAAEGLARDVIRVVQQARRAAGLAVTDRISLTIAASPAAQQAMREHRQLIITETLASTVELTGPDALDADPAAGDPVLVGDGEQIRVRLAAV